MSEIAAAPPIAPRDTTRAATTAAPPIAPRDTAPAATPAAATAATVAPVHSRRLASVAFAVALLGVEAVIILESYRGLVGFAEMIGIHGAAALGVPISLDGVALAAAAVALRAELAGEASGLYRLTLFAFTAASAAANWYHGVRAGGAASALYLGGMSLAVAWVFTLSLRQIRHESRRAAGATTERRPSFSPAHWARYPRLTFRAWSLAIRDGHTSPRAAIEAARLEGAGRARRPAKAAAAEPARSPAPAAGRPPVRRKAAPRPRPAVTPAAEGDFATMRLADAIRAGLAEVGEQPREVIAWLAERGRPGVPASRVYDVMRRDREAARGRLTAA
jgi:hypothetical protein